MDHKSSHIASSHYDPSAKTLDVTFHSGPTYRYSGVDPTSAGAFQSARSTGTHLRQHIAGRFKHTILP